MKVKLFGVGACGHNQFERLFADDFTSAECYLAIAHSGLLGLSHCDNQIFLRSEEAYKLDEQRYLFGRMNALAKRDEIIAAMSGADCVLLAAGMGGPTGSGATPVFSEIAKELGIPVVAVVVKPFGFEGKKRAADAETGINELKKTVDLLVAVSNEKILKAGSDMNFAFCMDIADGYLKKAIKVIAGCLSEIDAKDFSAEALETVLGEEGIPCSKLDR